MLIKEEYEHALARFYGNGRNFRDDCELFFQLIQEHFDPQPYKLEDLKPNMWVFDLKDAKCKKIESIYRDFNNNITIIGFDDYDEELFEENRFYPVTKALQYQVGVD